MGVRWRWKKMEKKYRFRFKGKFSDGSRKLVIEEIQSNKITTLNLPKAKALWDVLKKNDMPQNDANNGTP